MLPDFRVRQRDYLLEISRAMTQELDLDKLLGRILDISIEMLVGQAGMIALRSNVGGWHVQVSKGLSPTFLHLIKPYLAQFQGEKNPQSNELAEINRWLVELAGRASLGFLNGVGLPLIAHQKVIGVIFIFRTSPMLFTTNERVLLQSFADQAAIAVHNAQFYTQAVQEKQRLDALLDTSADGMLILQPDLRIERLNPALLRMLSLTKDEVIGNLHEQIIKWIITPKDGTLEKAVAGGWPLTPNAILYVEGDIKRNAGLLPLPVSITYAPLILKDGSLANIIANIRDITRFRQAEELKSTFISIISHELKTPVALIKGYVSTLRRDDARWDRKIVQESLEVIEEEADRLANLIENLLDASRLQAGGFPIRRSDCSIPQLAKRVANKFRSQTSKHTLLLDFPKDFPVVLGDEDRLEQVFANLLSNSLKYAPGGEIRISGQVRPDVCIVCVSDEGPGIEPEDLPFVFDRFYRSPEMAKKSKGAGLGLYLSKAVIEAHGGKIWVDKGKGIGTRICFSLPRK
jgi:signal transduction histidine kinase